MVPVRPKCWYHAHRMGGTITRNRSVRVTTYFTFAMPATSEEMVERISSVAKVTT